MKKKYEVTFTLILEYITTTYEVEASSEATAKASAYWKLARDNPHYEYIDVIDIKKSD